jgi:N-acetylmuramoyl-L-alanine amidase
MATVVNYSDYSSLWDMSRKTGHSVKDILKANEWEDSKGIDANSQVKLPSKEGDKIPNVQKEVKVEAKVEPKKVIPKKSKIEKKSSKSEELKVIEDKKSTESIKVQIVSKCKLPKIIIDPGHGYTLKTKYKKKGKWHTKKEIGTTGTAPIYYTWKDKPLIATAYNKLAQNVLDNLSSYKGTLLDYNAEIHRLSKKAGCKRAWCSKYIDKKKKVYKMKYINNASERAFSYDVAQVFYQELIDFGYPQEKIKLFRAGSGATRTGNDGETLLNRRNYSKKKKFNADYYISIHANGNGSNIAASGFFMMYAANKKNTEKRNKKSKVLAEDIASEYSLMEADSKGSIQKSARGLALFDAKNTSKRLVLIECGYMSNPQEAVLLFKEDSISTIGKDIFKGLIVNIKKEFPKCIKE